MKVSVIMPSYNNGKYLTESIGSVLSQSYPDIELIVVDDGSTDNTQEILDRINDPRMRRIKISNSGVSAARNAGLDMASGEYIAFLDADDRWLPSKLEMQVQLIEAEPSIGLVFTDFKRFDAKSVYPQTLFAHVPELNMIPRRPAKIHNSYVITGDTFASLASTSEMATWVQTILVKSEAVRNLRFPEGIKLCEDYHYMLRLYEKVQAAYIDEPMVEVRRHDTNSYSNGAQMLEPKVEVLSMVLMNTTSRKNKIILDNRLGRAWAAVGYSNFWSGDIRKSGHAYIQAAMHKGSFWNALKHIMALPLAPLLARFSRH